MWICERRSTRSSSFFDYPIHIHTHEHAYTELKRLTSIVYVDASVCYDITSHSGETHSHQQVQQYKEIHRRKKQKQILYFYIYLKLQ